MCSFFSCEIRAYVQPLLLYSLFTTEENETMSRTVSIRQITEEKMSIAQIPIERMNSLWKEYCCISSDIS